MTRCPPTFRRVALTRPFVPAGSSQTCWRRGLSSRPPWRRPSRPQTAHGRPDAGVGLALASLLFDDPAIPAGDTAVDMHHRTCRRPYNSIPLYLTNAATPVRRSPTSWPTSATASTPTRSSTGRSPGSSSRAAGSPRPGRHHDRLARRDPRRVGHGHAEEHGRHDRHGPERRARTAATERVVLQPGQQRRHDARQPEPGRRVRRRPVHRLRPGRLRRHGHAERHRGPERRRTTRPRRTGPGTRSPTVQARHAPPTGPPSRRSAAADLVTLNPDGRRRRADLRRHPVRTPPWCRRPRCPNGTLSLHARRRGHRHVHQVTVTATDLGGGTVTVHVPRHHQRGRRHGPPRRQLRRPPRRPSDAGADRDGPRLPSRPRPGRPRRSISGRWPRLACHGRRTP